MGRKRVVTRDVSVYCIGAAAGPAPPRPRRCGGYVARHETSVQVVRSHTAGDRAAIANAFSELATELLHDCIVEMDSRDRQAGDTDRKGEWLSRPARHSNNGARFFRHARDPTVGNESELDIGPFFSLTVHFHNFDPIQPIIHVYR